MQQNTNPIHKLTDELLSFYQRVKNSEFGIKIRQVIIDDLKKVFKIHFGDYCLFTDGFFDSGLVCDIEIVMIKMENNDEYVDLNNKLLDDHNKIIEEPCNGELVQECRDAKINNKVSNIEIKKKNGKLTNKQKKMINEKQDKSLKKNKRKNNDVRYQNNSNNNEVNVNTIEDKFNMLKIDEDSRLNVTEEEKSISEDESKAFKKRMKNKRKKERQKQKKLQMSKNNHNPELKNEEINVKIDTESYFKKKFLNNNTEMVSKQNSERIILNNNTINYKQKTLKNYDEDSLMNFTKNNEIIIAKNTENEATIIKNKLDTDKNNEIHSKRNSLLRLENNNKHKKELDNRKNGIPDNKNSQENKLSNNKNNLEVKKADVNETEKIIYNKIKNILEQIVYIDPKSVIFLEKAVFPAIKFKSKSFDINFTLQIKDTTHIKNIQYIKDQFKNKSFLKPLFLLLDYILKERKLNDQLRNGLSKYIEFLMLVHFCELHPLIQHLDINKNLGVVLMDFFQFYGLVFPYEKTALNLKDFKYIKKGNTDAILSILNPIDSQELGERYINMLTVKEVFEYLYKIMKNSLNKKKDKFINLWISNDKERNITKKEFDEFLKCIT